MSLTVLRPRRVARISDLSTEALSCHAFGHSWDEPPLIRFNYWGFDARLLLLTCTSCGTERRDVRDSRNVANLITRLYRYPHDYLTAFTAERWEYVEEWFRRFPQAPEVNFLQSTAWREWGVA